MHQMCSEANFQKFSGTHVERDFVEMPSQMLENWIWDKQILKKVSSHYLTKKPLPDKVIDKKIASKNEFGAMHTLTAIFQSSLDLLLHSAHDSVLLQDTSPGLALWRK